MNNVVITKDGFKFQENVKVGDLIYGDNEWVEIRSVDVVTAEVNKIVMDNGLEVDVVNEVIETNIKGQFSIPNISTKINVGFGTSDFGGDSSLEFQPHLNRGKRLRNTLNFPKSLDSEFCYLLGYSYGDGCVEYRQNDGKFYKLSLACSDDYVAIKTKIHNILSNISDIVKSKRGDGKLDVISLSSIEFLENLYINGILKQKAGKLIIPNKILTSNLQNQISFFCGFFDADGCAQKSKKSYKISIIDKIILQYFQLVLLVSGITSTFGLSNKFNCPDTWSQQYRLNVTGKHSIKILQSLYTDSVKINESNITTIRDSNLTIYNIRQFGLNGNCDPACNSDQNLSYSVFEKLKKRGLLPETCLPYIQKEIVNIVKFTGTAHTLKTTNDKPYWCNGVFLKSNT